VPRRSSGLDDETFNAWQQAIAPLGYAKWGDTEQTLALAGTHLAAARAFLSGDAPTDLPDRLRNVPAPTLVIAGAQDVTIGVDTVVAVADLFPKRARRGDRARRPQSVGRATSRVPRRGGPVPRSAGVTRGRRFSETVT